MNKVCFDVDGTLIDIVEDVPRYQVIQMFLSLQRMNCEMYIWSGGGVDYAERWRDKLGLKATIARKGEFVPDIAFDDEEVTLGKVNIRV